MIGGLIIMLGCCGMPGGVNPNDKTVMINPPGRTTTGGLMKTLHRLCRAFISHGVTESTFASVFN